MVWISRRVDLTPVYAMIFRHLKTVGADWVYHFPEIGIVELAPGDDAGKPGDRYSVSEAVIAPLVLPHAYSHLAPLVGVA